MKPRRLNYIGLLAISILCLLLILASHRFNSNSYVSSDFYQIPAASNSFLVAEHQRQFSPKNLLRYHRKGGGGDSFTSVSSPGSNSNSNSANGGSTFNATLAIHDVLSVQRHRIENEMDSFEFDDPSITLSMLTPATGGKPFRSVILTTWRSGSTFLGDILNAMPANYYHYEPLLNFDIVQIRDGDRNSDTALRNLRQLLTCNYTHMDDYLAYGQTHNYLFSHNTRLWEYCRLYPELCWNPDFLGPFCKLFPLQSMKVVRLRLAAAEPMFTDPELENVRFILLIRDPRGTMQSRKHRDWCPGQPDCDDAAVHCRDMESDYYTAQNLLEKYPNRFKVLRYEDLSLEPYPMTQSILKFYGLPFDVAVEMFLDSHTRSDIGGVSSTFRDSKSAPFHWINDLSFYEIERIQSSCEKAMQLWGYRLANRTSFRRRSFNPMLNYTMWTTTQQQQQPLTTQTSTPYS